MTDPVQHLKDAGHLDRFFIDGSWRAPKGRAKPIRLISTKRLYGPIATHSQ